MLKKILKNLANIYWRVFKTPEEWARHIGVNLGEHCLIDTRNWSNEPYLITIGSNVQLTRCVSIHTHGGGMP